MTKAHRICVGRNALATALMAISSLSAPALAQAQEAPADEGTAARNDTNSLDEIVVSARRREERLIDVPVAAAALTSEGIQRYNSTDLASIARNIPGVTLSRAGGGGNGGSFSIRGVGNLATDYGNEQPVAINVDGVQITRGRIAAVGLFDVERVEVLKGPQALFFGKNSPAGVVSLTSVTPGDTLEGYVRANYEVTTVNPQVEAAISVPLTESLSMRIAGRWSKMYGGYISNDAGPLANPFDVNPATGLRDFINPAADYSEAPGTRQSVGRITIAFRPDPRFDVTLRVLGSRERDVGGYSSNEVVECGIQPNPSINLGVRLPDPFANCKADYHRSNGVGPNAITQNIKYGPKDGKPLSLTDNVVSSLTANYKADNFTLTSVTGFYYSKNFAFDNYEATNFAQALDAQREKNRQYTQEFRLVTELEGPFNVSAGVFYQHDNRDWLNTDKIAPLGPVSAAGAVAAVAPGLNVAEYVGIWNSAIFTADNKVDVYSAFGQARLKIGETLELAGGARWTQEKKRTDIGAEFNRIASFSPPGYRYHPSTNDKNISPEVTLTWKPQPDLTTYVAYKTGFLSAGIQNPGNVINYHGTCLTRAPTNVVGCENDLLTYDAQKVKGFEAGIKGYFLDNRLIADLSVYHYKFSNLQVTTFDPTTLSFLIQNAGGSRSQGAEFQAQYRASDVLRLRTSLSYTDLKYSEYSSGPCYQGQPIQPFIPLSDRQVRGCYAIPGAAGGQQYLTGARYGDAPFQANLGFTLSQPVGTDRSIDLTLDYYYYSRAPRGIASYVSGGEAHSVLNGSIRFELEKEQLELAIIGTNLLNDTWYPVPVTAKPYGFFTATSGDWTSILQPPRMVTLQVTKKF